MQKKILLIDDEASVRSVVESIVTDAGYEFCYAQSGEEGLEAFAQEKPDLIVLDVMMPGIDGYETCRRLRERGAKIPVIFLSAKGDIIDQGSGFGAGGDDYISKPFSPKELVLRIDARLRQQERASTRASSIAVDGIMFDQKRHAVEVRGEWVSLTAKEFAILHLLASHPGEVFSRDQVIEAIWGDDYVGEMSNLAVFVRKIREKIEEDPSHPRYLQTVWRVGYRFGD